MPMLPTRVPVMARRLAQPVSRAASTLAEARRRWMQRFASLAELPLTGQNGRLVVSPEVEAALEAGRPVVALESAIITHGMPHPANLSTAESVESIVRAHGAVPATVALHAGRVHVGLSGDMLRQIADPASRGDAAKVSRRDLAAVLARRWTGGTTVAGTMVIAHSVGIKAFVTGGIGGVHRGGESSMDVSADLIELGRTPMAVVCAGAKSILDIPRTLEVLETHGVCVATLGAAAFPAFYSPSSGAPSPWSVPDVAAAAELVHAALSLPDPQATLLAVPIPAAHAAAGAAVQRAVEQAVRESEDAPGARGRDATPWLLARVGELTRGRALALNVALIENNAAVGARLAGRLAELARDGADHASRAVYPSAAVPAPSSSAVPGTSSSSVRAAQAAPADTSPRPLLPPTVLVFGSAAIDITSSTPLALAPRTTTPGSVRLSAGGVGRNIAEAAQRLLPPGSVMVVSPIGQAADGGSGDGGGGGGGGGDDAFGAVLRAEMAAAGLRTDGLFHVGGASTAVCSLTLERGGDLVAGVADMAVVERLDGARAAAAVSAHRPTLVVLDLNLTADAVRAALDAAHAAGIPTIVDATSVPKTLRLLPALRARPGAPTHVCPNTLELAALYDALLDAPDSAAGADEAERAWAFLDALALGAEWRAALAAWHAGRGWAAEAGAVAQMTRCLYWCRSWWLKCGDKGLVHFALDEASPGAAGGAIDVKAARAGRVVFPTPAGTLRLTHYPPPAIRPDEIVSTTGAGDTLVGGIVAGLVAGGPQDEWVARATERVGRTLRSQRAVG